jgi:hypothetical protein
MLIRQAMAANGVGFYYPPHSAVHTRPIMNERVKQLKTYKKISICPQTVSNKWLHFTS